LRLRLPDGTSMIVELQVHLAKILEFKAETHVYYEYFRTYFCGNVDVVAERMQVLETIADDASGNVKAGLADAAARAVVARNASKLAAFDNFLEKLAAYGLLAVVRECRRSMALAAHGEGSVEYSSALNGVASLLKKQGKYEAAEPLYRCALNIYEEQLGPDHPNITTSLNNLAVLLMMQGKYEATEPLYRRALKMKEK